MINYLFSIRRFYTKNSRQATCPNQVRISEELWERQISETQRNLNKGELHIRYTEDQQSPFIGGYFVKRDKIWKSVSAFEASTSWNRGAPWNILKSLIKFYLLVSFLKCLLFISNWLSEVYSLLMWGEIVSPFETAMDWNRGTH